MELKNKRGHHKIAIVGISSLFPGALNSKDFWLNILSERDFIKDVPDTHWLKEDYYDPEDKTGDMVYCQKGGFLDNIPFDPVEFGLPPNLLKTTDTVQLLSLIVARDTLADTISYTESKVDKENVSVILGVAAGTELFVEMSAKVHKPEWVDAMRKQGLPEHKINAIKKELNTNFTHWDENTFPGLLGNVVSGRIANRFDFNGTNCVLDAACASSLAAIKMGIQELQLGTTDMVITGGSDALNDISMYMCFNRTTALSPTQDCRPFSDKGDGTVLGEGVAMMSLKRLEDAERDGDKIYGVITAIGSASDGKSGSIYAPDSTGQSRAIKRAYEAAGFSPDAIGLIEAHGTGTMAGDYQEFGGLRIAFGETRRNQYCALGSVKSMIGHTKSAAGAASLVKAVMALNNKVLPPTIKIEKPNPKLNLQESPFYLNTKARPWIHHENTTRKAGISSMGFGGTNFHIALEEYDQHNNRPPRIYNRKKELLLLSGKNKEGIQAAIAAVKHERIDEDLVSLARSSQLNFDANAACRLAVLGADMPEIMKWLDVADTQLNKGSDAFEMAHNVYYSSGKTEGKLAFLFAGQGSQYLNMGSELLMQYDEALLPWNQISVIPFEKDRSLHHVVYPIPVFSDEDRARQAALLVETQWAQPAIGTLSLSHLNLLNTLNITPDAVGGHSYGEIVALYAAGVITSQEDLIKISRKRGELMAAAGEKHEGTMTAVFAPQKEVAKLIQQSETKAIIANINSPSQTVISGPSDEVKKAELYMDNSGVKYQRLNVSTAFHSEVISDSATAFESYLKTIAFGSCHIPIYSNTSGKKYPGKKPDYANILATQLASPVQFEMQIKEMYDNGIRTFLELGPNKILGNFVTAILKGKKHTAISIDHGKKVNSKDAFWSALGQLCVAGVPVSFTKIWKNIDDNVKAKPVKEPSVATVEINGSNYGKPYPPEGGFKNLPKPNPEPREPEISNGTPEAVFSTPEMQDVPKAPQFKETPTSKPVNSLQGGKNGYVPPASDPTITIKKHTNTNHPQQKNKMTKVNEQWLQAFQEIQKNTLEAQKNIQKTLADSHRLFMETSQVAFRHLGNMLTDDPYKTNTGIHQHSTVQKQLSNPRDSLVPPAVEPPKIRERVPIPPPVIEEKTPVTAPQAAIKEDIAPAAKPVASDSDFKEIMLGIVAEKTGYPKEILDLNTDLESGLGIDSIKRVEILSALQETYPSLKQVDTAKLAAMNTLGEILDFAKQEQEVPDDDDAPRQVVPDAGNPVRPHSERTVDAAANGHEDLSDFKDTMLDIVATKTGYPKEILDLTTDLESGLGIDSIKRVEILSALQETYPSLKQVDTAKLAAMNTLQEILDFSTASQKNNEGGVSESGKKKP